MGDDSRNDGGNSGGGGGSGPTGRSVDAHSADCGPRQPQWPPGRGEVWQARGTGGYALHTKGW